MTKYPIVVEKANGNYSAYCPDLPGCVATGPTVDETVMRMKEAMELHIHGLKEDDLPIPRPSTEVAYIEVVV